MKLRANPGFTIVELLIVIVVIALLATISIVAYNGVQNRAKASQATAALTQAKKKLEIYKVDNAAYPTTGNLASAGVSDGATTYQYTSDGSSFCLTATAGNVSYKTTNTGGSEQGGCAGHGQGGVDAITNLAANPSVETNGSSWTARWYGSGGAGTTTLTSAAALFGTMGYRKTWTTAGGGQDIGFSYTQPVTVGKTYTFSAYVRASVTTQHRISVTWYDAGNAITGSGTIVPAVSVPSNTWQRFSVTGTAPTGAVSALIAWGPYPPGGSPTAVVGQTIDFDGVMVTEGSTLYPYADGSSPNWVWNGAPNNSTSTGPSS